MTNELTQEEKISLVQSKTRTYILMQESLESYLLEETDTETVKEYEDSIKECKSIINALKAFKETC
jgi:hypothetical protein